MGRVLPDRRLKTIDTVKWAGATIHAEFGFSTCGHVKEVFLKGGREGTHVLAVLEDTGVLLSKALQRGLPLAELSVVLKAQEIEAADGGRMRRAYRLARKRRT